MATKPQPPASQTANAMVQTSTSKPLKIVEDTQNKIMQFVSSGELKLPPDYAVGNALKAAWLKLQDLVDKDKKPVLEVCERASIANALLSMAIQALDPNKNQCYFIAYGKNLAMQRSYFGTMMLAKRMNPAITDIIADVICEGDTFNVTRERGRHVIIEHTTPNFMATDRPIIGAYCTVYYGDGTEEATIMRLDEIHQAWRQSKAYPFNDNGTLKPTSVHFKFPKEMCKRTVVNRACKLIINASTDANLFLANEIKKMDLLSEQLEAQARIADNANTEIIDIEEIEPALIANETVTIAETSDIEQVTFDGLEPGEIPDMEDDSPY